MIFWRILVKDLMPLTASFLGSPFEVTAKTFDNKDMSGREREEIHFDSFLCINIENSIKNYRNTIYQYLMICIYDVTFKKF